MSKLNRTQKLRADNLFLLRAIHGGHGGLALKLERVANSNYISKMATGVMAISNLDATQIESTLNLPKGWLDRDNGRLLVACSIDVKIIQALSLYSVERKEGLLKLLTDTD